MNIRRCLRILFKDESRGIPKESSGGCSGFGSQDFSSKHGLRRFETGTGKMERGS
jgi:hypothetical protein